MSTKQVAGTVLVVGASGSIGRHAVAVAAEQGWTVKALLRNPAKAAGWGWDQNERIQVVVGDVTDPASLTEAVKDIDAVVFTHGSDGAGKAGARNVDYGAVRNVIAGLGGRRVRVALMTAIGVTDRIGSYNQATEAHDWKRRSERLIRASQHPYTIVRPAWFDYNHENQHQLVFLQGDTRRSGTPADGAIARRQIADVLITALSCDKAISKTLELVAEDGPAQPDLTPLFAALAADPRTELFDGVDDQANMALTEEPADVRRDLEAVTNQI